MPGNRVLAAPVSCAGQRFPCPASLLSIAFEPTSVWQVYIYIAYNVYCDDIAVSLY